MDERDLGAGWTIHELPLLSDTRQTWSSVTAGEERRMSRAWRRLRPDSGTPDTRNRISPIWQINVSSSNYANVKTIFLPSISPSPRQVGEEIFS